MVNRLTFLLDDVMQRAVMEGSDATTLHAIAREQGMITLFEDGLRKVVTGQTSLEEVARVTQDQIESDQSTSDEESIQIQSVSMS